MSDTLASTAYQGRYGEEKRNPTARVEIMEAPGKGTINVDHDVTIVIKGKVKSIKGVEEGKTTDYKYVKGGPDKKVERKYTEPGCIEVETTSVSIVKNGEFDGMLDD